MAADDASVAADDQISADRQAVVTAGHSGDVDTARSGLTHADPGIRSAAIGAMVRLGVLDSRHLEDAAVAGEDRRGLTPTERPRRA